MSGVLSSYASAGRGIVALKGAFSLGLECRASDLDVVRDAVHLQLAAEQYCTIFHLRIDLSSRNVAVSLPPNAGGGTPLATESDQSIIGGSL